MAMLETVVKRGDKWCVIHCHGAEAGKAIKCFSTKAQADAMHRAIQANKETISATEDSRPPKAWWDKCIASVSGKADDPDALCNWIWHYQKENVTEAYRHPDFNRILDEFNNYYCKGDILCQRGESEYYQWLKDLNLDETRRYGAAYESFAWARDKIQLLREDDKNKYYKILVGFPIESMNGNVYKERDLIAAALTLKGLHPNLNHKQYWHFTPDSEWGEIATEDAKYEDGAVEAILRVSKSAICPICDGRKMYELIDSKGIVNVSLQGGCALEREVGATRFCDGFQFDEKGFSLLTKDVLPGIPMARIFPLESIMVEALQTSTRRKRKVKTIKMEVYEEDEKPEPEKDEHGCVVGKQKYDEESGKCVPIPPQEQAPRSDAERAKAHFNISDEEWNKLSDEEKQAYIDKLPERGSAEQMTQVIPIDAPIKTTMEPDEHGQCKPGYRLNALGKCVKTEDCPEGQHWSAEANEGNGGCVPDTPPAVEHPETAVGKSPAPREDVLTMGPTEVPKPGEEPPVAHPPPPKAVPKVDVAPEAPTSLPSEIPEAGKEPSEPHDCGAGRHWDADANQCVPDKPLPSPEAGATAAERRLELSQAKFNELKAKGQLETVQQQVAFWETQFNTANVERLKLKGQVEEQSKRVEKLENLRDQAVRDFNNMQVERDEQKRKWEREVAQREEWKERAENYKKQYDDVARKYNDSLKVNLELSKKLTQAHEDYLDMAAKAEGYKGKLNKAKSISKKIIKLRA